MSKENIKFFDVDNNITVYKFRSGEYKKIKTLGEGSFGKVLLVEPLNSKDQKDSKYFALKISKRFKKVKKEKNKANENTKENIDEDAEKNQKPKEVNFVELRELTIMKKLSRSKSMNIVKMIDYNLSLEEKEIWILMDYLPTDFMKFFHDNKHNKEVMNEKFFKNIAYQIIKGVQCLHEQRIIHRDIKLENILYDQNTQTVKIGDFGLSRIFDYSLESQYTDVGTYPYKPPEVLLGLRKYTTAFDIWSIGCLLVQICTMSHLFGENSPLGVLKLMYNIFGSFNDNVLPGYKNFPNSSLISKLPENQGIGLINYIEQHKQFGFENNNFYDLISKMLCIDPTKRINASECLMHPWFRDVSNQ